VNLEDPSRNVHDAHVWRLLEDYESQAEGEEQGQATGQSSEDIDLGIIQDREDITELAMAEFACHFHGQVLDHFLAAMHALFKVGPHDDQEINEALLHHGKNSCPGSREVWRRGRSYPCLDHLCTTSSQVPLVC
jgi:hypothetical protein